VFPIDPALERQQAERVRAVRARRDQAAVDAALADAASSSGKARKARDYGIPVIGVAEFLRLAEVQRAG
jgi:hypothetical protein